MANDRELSAQVWIDQELCTGDGLCVQLVPEIFDLDIDGLAYVKDETGQPDHSPRSQAPVPVGLGPAVHTAVAECPGACIHLTALQPPPEPLR